MYAAERGVSGPVSRPPVMCFAFRGSNIRKSTSKPAGFAQRGHSFQTRCDSLDRVMFSNARQVCTESSQSAPADEDEAVREAHHFKVWKADGNRSVDTACPFHNETLKICGVFFQLPTKFESFQKHVSVTLGRVQTRHKEMKLYIIKRRSS